jgi:putative tricarboxylic transport membrane protein
MAVGVVAYGLFLMVETTAIPVSPGYAQVGPRVFPWIISSALLVLGLFLVWQAWRGAWEYDDEESIAGFDLQWRPFLWLAVGFLLYIALVNTGGFILASASLFAAVARTFGSRRPLADIAIGLVLGFLIFAGFGYGLGLRLPAGIFQGIL